MQAAVDAGNALLDLLYPPKCYLCGSVGAWLCEDCIAAWPRPEDPRCPDCGHPLPLGPCGWCARGMRPLEAAGFSFAYSETVRDVVHLLKYSAKRRLAPWMAAEMARTFWSIPAMRQAGVLVPVGLHPKRLRQRGYNQSEWLARELAGILNLPVERWSTRHRDTRPQVGLSRAERAANLSGAFSAAPAAAGARILLIDDVSTTGATARAAASALRDQGAAWIGLLTFARDL